MRVGIVGAGVSGIATARVLAHLGHDVTVFERATAVGGVWLRAYAGVRLQNAAWQYRLSGFDWPFTPDLHPTREQILQYLEAAVARFDLDVRCGTEVMAMRSRHNAGWTLETNTRETHDVDLVVLAVGQFSGAPVTLGIRGQEDFAGRLITDRDLGDPRVLADREVVVVGFGKTAVDIATFAADRGSRVHHVFREPRWLVPRTMLGIHSAHIVFARAATGFIPAWAHGLRLERALHRHRRVVRAYWAVLGGLVRSLTGLHPLHRDPSARARMRAVTPRDWIPRHMRSGLALAPDGYYRHVRAGRIEPHQGGVERLEPDSAVLSDGTRARCDLLVQALGTPRPAFPYLPDRERALLEREPDGPQLYRHVLHPRISRLAFAGYNHSFLHIPCVESAAMWLDAVHRGDLTLPQPEEMEVAIEEIRRWKREHSLFEPSRSCGVNMRFQQYQDVILSDLELRVRRKGNVLAEAFSAYGPRDYDGLFEEYQRSLGRRRMCVPIAS